MTRVRIFAYAAAGLALAALGWCLSDAHAAFAGMSAVPLSRSAGLILFGVAMVAAGLVFRAAMTAPKTTTPVNAPLRAGEFRRGFGDRVVRAKAQLRQPTQREVVVKLRHAVAAQERAPQVFAGSTTLPPAELARLHDLLCNHAEQLRSRHAEQAKRHFLRSGVDVHGLAEN
jgi:hypothetical protein